MSKDNVEKQNQQTPNPAPQPSVDELNQSSPSDAKPDSKSGKENTQSNNNTDPDESKDKKPNKDEKTGDKKANGANFESSMNNMLESLQKLNDDLDDLKGIVGKIIANTEFGKAISKKIDETKDVIASQMKSVKDYCGERLSAIGSATGDLISAHWEASDTKKALEESSESLSQFLSETKDSIENQMNELSDYIAETDTGKVISNAIQEFSDFKFAETEVGQTILKASQEFSDFKLENWIRDQMPETKPETNITQNDVTAPTPSVTMTSPPGPPNLSDTKSSVINAAAIEPSPSNSSEKKPEQDEPSHTAASHLSSTK